jgi:hypothetical protein
VKVPSKKKMDVGIGMDRMSYGEPIPNMCSATAIAPTMIAMLMRNRQDSDIGVSMNEGNTPTLSPCGTYP